MSLALPEMRSKATRDEDHEHCPLADLEVVADVNRAIEDLAVQRVDVPVEADEVLCEPDAARNERLVGMRRP
jgi:hypothetical protein